MPEPSALQSLDIPVPPPETRYRIGSSAIEAKTFLDSGRECASEILRILNLAAVDVQEFRSILDFGCGCSRVLRYFIPFLPGARFYGCDIDPVAIEWSNRNVLSAEYSLIFPRQPILANNSISSTAYPYSPTSICPGRFYASENCIRCYGQTPTCFSRSTARQPTPW